MAYDCKSRVLGLLCTVQSNLQVLAKRDQFAPLLEHGLASVPGVASATLTLEEPSPPMSLGDLAASGRDDGLCIPLNTAEWCYGRLEIDVDSPLAFAPYRPFIQNLVNATATELACRDYAAERDQVKEVLEREREQRSREMQHREEFLAMLGHELRNPLAAIHNAVSLQQAVAIKHDLVERSRQIIARQAERMAQAVDDLVDAWQVSHGAIAEGADAVDTQATSAHAADEAGEVKQGSRVDRSKIGPESAWRFLIVDDNHDIADTLAHIIDIVGHQVAVAHCGPRALELARDCRPDVILCDVGLGEPMSGFEVARRLGARSRRNTPLLIAITGYGGEKSRHQALEAGFDHHMTKPVSVDDILAVVREHK